MIEAKVGDRVRVHYKGFVKGMAEMSVPFVSTEGADPMEFKLGDGTMIPGFEEAIVGMHPGDKKTVTIPPEKGYGQYRQDLEIELQRTKLPPDVDPQVGQELEIYEDDGRVIPVEVMDIVGDMVVVNANHPMAGMELIFDIQLVEIV